MADAEFTVQVHPRELVDNTDPFHAAIRVVYDLRVRDAHNYNLLVFSNQGYENRQDAVDIARKLFAGRPATLLVSDGDGFLDYELDLAAI